MLVQQQQQQQQQLYQQQQQQQHQVDGTASAAQASLLNSSQSMAAGLQGSGYQQALSGHPAHAAGGRHLPYCKAADCSSGCCMGHRHISLQPHCSRQRMHCAAMVPTAPRSF
jgi:hypothetical protein